MSRHSKIACICFLFFASSCDGLFQTRLGEHLSFWNGDKTEENIIVYCEGDCNGGIYVAPTYARHYDSTGRYYAEYVEDVRSNKQWVIAKTLRIKENVEYYWIISKDLDLTNVNCSNVNCDSIIKQHVTGPLILDEFNGKLRTLNINLKF